MPLEIAVDSERDAVAAAPFADRIELCGDLARHGLTPPANLIRSVARALAPLARRPELVVLIRPTVLNVLSASELAACERATAEAIEAGADGFAFGALDDAGLIDRASCERLLVACAGRSATFHRAFDFACDRTEALRALIALGFDRVLTAGVRSFDHSTVPPNDRFAAIRDTATRAKGAIAVVACGGVRSANAGAFLAVTPEVHSSCRSSGVFDVREAGALRAAVGAGS